MPPFLSTTKALRSLVSLSNGLRQLVSACRSNIQFSQPDQCRCCSAIAGARTGPSIIRLAIVVILNIFQRVCLIVIMFFKQGSFLDVEMVKKVFNPKFMRRSAFWGPRYLKHYPDGSFDAELEIGFKFLIESYVSHVELDRPKRIKTTVSQSTLFDHLIKIWELNPGPVPGTCNLYFFVDFKFHSPLYRQVASMFYKEVASRMVGSFTERCRLIYGPEVPILENSFGERT